MPGGRNRPHESGCVPHPSTSPVAASDESQQSDLLTNNIGRIAPLTEEPTPPGPSSDNDYRKFFKYAWMMALLFVTMVVILMITPKTIAYYLRNLIMLIYVVIETFSMVMPKLPIWELQSVVLTGRASIDDEKQKFDKCVRKNTPRIDLFFNNTCEILQIYRVTVTGNYNADPILRTEPPTVESTPICQANDKLKQQSDQPNNNVPAEPLDDSTTGDESKEARINMPDLSERVSTSHSESTYDDKQKFYKHIGKTVLPISLFFLTVSPALLCSSWLIANQTFHLVREIIAGICLLIFAIGLFLFVHSIIKKPSPRTAKTQLIFMVFGIFLIFLFIVIAAVLIVSPPSLLEGAVWVVIIVFIVALLGAYLWVTARKTEDNRQN